MFGKLQVGSNVEVFLVKGKWMAGNESQSIYCVSVAKDDSFLWKKATFTVDAEELRKWHKLFPLFWTALIEWRVVCCTNLPSS